MIFSDRGDHVALAYRVFPYSLAIKLPISVSHVAETILMEHAIARRYTYVNHGRDRNLYGMYNAIGVAGFKLQAGYKPHISKTSRDIPPLKTFRWNGVDDIYVFLRPEKDWKITDALFVSADKDEQHIKERYPILFSDSAPKLKMYS